MHADGATIEYEIAWGHTFHDALSKLPPTHVRAVLDAVTKFQKGHPSVHLHALPPMKWVSFCVSKDAVRVICARESSTLLLAYVDFHDAAYRWAERHEPRNFGVNVRFVKIDIDEETPRQDDEIKPPGPLAHVLEKAFRAFGVSPALARTFRAVPDNDGLLDLCTCLDAPLADALLSLASDSEDVAGIVERYDKAKQGATASLSEAVKSAVNSQYIWVVPPEQQALEKALQDSEAWRVFLHPSQKKIVSMKTNGPYLVTGGPGTGKTVVLLHRARHLAATLDDKKPILVTTFSRVLVRQLAQGIEGVCADAAELAQRITVMTLVEVARGILSDAKLPSALLMREDLDAAWEEVSKLDIEKRGRSFFDEEREDIVLPQEIESEAAFLRASRPGRGEKLDQKSKKQIWRVLAAYEAALRKRGGSDMGGLAMRAVGALRDGATSPFAAVLCDEVQDASLFDLKLLAALGSGPDRLFLCGDGHQRLYRRPTSLRSLGIEVRGRSARLSLNYRTTQGICAAALAAVDGVSTDVIDEEAALETAGYRSLRAGKAPERHTFASQEEEADYIAQQIRTTTERPLLILSRTKTRLGKLQQLLSARGLTIPILGDTELMPKGDAVLLATLHRSKGLEAPRVLLAGMEDSPQRFRGRTDKQREQFLRQERLLVYVGMTRARDWCALTRVERPRSS